MNVTERVYTHPEVDEASRDALEKMRATNRDMTARFAFAMLRLGKHVYLNTVPAQVVARRRARDKVAKASRKANR